MCRQKNQTICNYFNVNAWMSANKNNFSDVVIFRLERGNSAVKTSVHRIFRMMIRLFHFVRYVHLKYLNSLYWLKVILFSSRYLTDKTEPKVFGCVCNSNKLSLKQLDCKNCV